MTCYRSAYTVDEKVVFMTVAAATVFETFTYQEYYSKISAKSFETILFLILKYLLFIVLDFIGS